MNQLEALHLVERTIHGLSTTNAIPAHLTDAKILGDSTFDDLGLDSLDRLAVVLEVQRVAEVLIGDKTLAALSTVKDLAISVMESAPASPVYRGGENFDLADVLIRVRRTNLNQRTKLCVDFLDGLRNRRQLLSRRTILSRADREVVVLDPYSRQPQKMLMFGSNNYLGLAAHPHVEAYVRRAIGAWGVGLGGAPLLNGYTQLHHELEERLAALKGTEDALLFSSGYATNIGLISALVRPTDILLHDEYIHASTVDGIKQSGVATHPFPHNDFTAVSASEAFTHISENNADVFVAVEGLYSMDGDIAPLKDMIHVCHEKGAYLILDDAHGTGVLGRTGRGTAEHWGVDGEVDITMGTFSKTFAVTGGFVAASRDLIEYLRYFTRSYMFSTSLPSIAVAAVLGGIEAIEREPWLLESLRANVTYLSGKLRALGFDASSDTPIIPLRVPTGVDMNAATLKFHELGIFVNSIEYPAVPVNQQRFRISVMASHRNEDLDKLVDAVQTVWTECRVR
jgi:8-amino-7-oxononanoate synthase